MVSRKIINGNMRLRYLSGLFSLILISATTIFFADAEQANLSSKVTKISPMTIEGHVTNEAGIPIEGAVLSVKWGDQETSSDPNGVFKIFNVSEQDTIAVKHPNYQTTEFLVEKSKASYFIALKNGKNVLTNSGQDFQKGERIDVSGKVSDETGKALSNVILIVAGTNQGTATDSSGNFKLSKTPINGKLSISHVGFATQTATIEKHKASYEIHLKKTVNELGEIVIVGYNMNHKPAQSPNNGRNVTNTSTNELVMIEQNADFPGGTQAMFRYLGQNIRYPTEASKAGVQGKAFISFTVNENGDIRNPRILEGLGSGIDEEVLRVVLNMPRWIPARQMNQTVSVNYRMPVHFQLESGTQSPPIEKK